MATTVGELIKALREFPKDQEVTFTVRDRNGNEAQAEVQDIETDIWFGTTTETLWFELRATEDLT